MNSHQARRAIVIGSGFGGLAAANCVSSWLISLFFSSISLRMDR